MRNLLIAILCIGSLIAAWVIFDHYSEKKLTSLTDQIDHPVMTDVEAKNWDKANASFASLSEDWRQYRKVLVFFRDTETVSQVDYGFAKAKYYMRVKDDSNGLGELAHLRQQLLFLKKNEKLSLQNIL